MKDPSCQSCVFWDRLSSDNSNSNSKKDMGRCKRYPPQVTRESSKKVLISQGNNYVIFNKRDDYKAKFPISHQSEWCGEFKLKK